MSTIRRISTIALFCCVSSLLSGCTTWNEVLLGVSRDDPDMVRDAARARTVHNGRLEIDATSICGMGALHLAIDNKNADVVLVLLQEGANPNMVAEEFREPSFCDDAITPNWPTPGTPALHYAIQRGEVRIAEDLLFFGAHWSATDADGKNALQLAQATEGMELVVAYIEAPTHLAARVGDLDTLNEELLGGADPNLRHTFLGTTPIEEALLQRKWFVAEYLLDNGAGTQDILSSQDVATAIGEYLEEAPDSAYVEPLMAIAALEIPP